MMLEGQKCQFNMSLVLFVSWRHVYTFNSGRLSWTKELPWQHIWWNELSWFSDRYTPSPDWPHVLWMVSGNGKPLLTHTWMISGNDIVKPELCQVTGGDI